VHKRSGVSTSSSYSFSPPCLGSAPKKKYWSSGFSGRGYASVFCIAGSEPDVNGQLIGSSLELVLMGVLSCQVGPIHRVVSSDAQQQTVRQLLQLVSRRQPRSAHRRGGPFPPERTQVGRNIVCASSVIIGLLSYILFQRLLVDPPD
jgi:hypothetical protein